MKKLFLYILAMVPTVLFAHESNKSFFKIEQKEATVEVVAQFPWTIRNALLEFAPNLKTSKNKKEFDENFYNYIKSAFVITDAEGNQLELLSVTPTIISGHSHKNDFSLVFKGITFNKITNTISFNLKHQQINHHTIIDGYETRVFETSIKNPSFNISKQHNASFGYLWFLLIIPIAFGIFLKKNNSFKLY